MSTAPTLEVTGLRAGYVPGVDILSGVTLAAAENAVTLVIGPNGAGKSTLLRAIFGLLKPGAGRVLFPRQGCDRRQPEHAQGGRRQLRDAGHQQLPAAHGGGEPDDGRVGVPARQTHASRRQLEQVYAMFPVLRDKRRDRAGSLSGGQGRMLSVARELMTQPSLLLIDEPTAGLAPNLVAQVYAILATARSATGAAILLVEQNVEEALPLADHLYLLNLGQVKAEGPGREFDNSRVRALVQECLLG